MGEPRVGDRFSVFDYRPWQETGDVDDNSCYFKPATVVAVRQDRYGERLIDVVFDHEPGRVSLSHFTYALRPLAS